MSSFRAIGTQVQMAFQTKFPTFTPDQFKNTLSGREFTVTNSQVPNPGNPQAPPIAVQLFSKRNMTIFFLPGINRLNFQILNTLDLNEIYEEIKQILLELNVISTVISNIGFACNTALPASNVPKEKLTSLIKNDFLESIISGIGTDVGITSIRLATNFPLERDAVQIVIEPLGTSPNDHYFISFLYQSINMDNFNNFVSSFGEDLISSIIEEVENIE